MRLRSTCCWICLLGLLVALPVFAQTSPVANSQTTSANPQANPQANQVQSSEGAGTKYKSSVQPTRRRSTQHGVPARANDA